MKGLIIILVILLISGCMDDDTNAYIEKQYNDSVYYVSDICNCSPAYEKGYEKGIIDTIKKIEEEKPKKGIPIK